VASWRRTIFKRCLTAHQADNGQSSWPATRMVLPTEEMGSDAGVGVSRRGRQIMVGVDRPAIELAVTGVGLDVL
jgi:hypothetical protein